MLAHCEVSTTCVFVSRACFDELQMKNVLVWLVLDYICDGVYILDIAVRLHTGNEIMNKNINLNCP